MSDGWAEAIRDLNTLAVDLTAAGARVGARAAMAVRKTAHDIEATSKAFSPVDTGALRSSIGTDVTGDGRSGSIEAEIGPTQSYGYFVEFGTSRQAPQSYMGAAFDRHAHELEDALGQIAGDILA